MKINMAVMRIILGAVMVATAAAVSAPYCRCSGQSTMLPPLDPCSNVTCTNGGTCEAEGETFLCLCPEGYQGQFCQDDVGLISCEGVDCNRGSCIEEDGVARCVCLLGGTGQFCENDLCLHVVCDQFISDSDCVVKEAVVNGEDPFECECDETTKGGRFCEEVACFLPNECSSGQGSCVPPNERENRPPENRRCECLDGFFGSRCEFQEESDGFVKCQNGGSSQFFEFDEARDCVCPDGFDGTFCENATCFGNSCENGGTCQVEGDSFTCSCPEGFTGELCENDLSDCLGVTCLNGGTCTFTFEEFTVFECLCHEGYSGDRCQFGPCLSNQLPTFCQNGGSCLDDRKNNRLLRCVCAEGFSGKLCEVGPCPGYVVCRDPGVCVIVNGAFNHCRCPEGAVCE